VIATGIVIVTDVTVAIGIATAAVVTNTRTGQRPEAATTDVTDSVTSASLANRRMQLAPRVLSVQAANSSIASARRAHRNSNPHRSRKEHRSRHRLPRAGVRNAAIGVIAETGASAGVVAADAVVVAAGTGQRRCRRRRRFHKRRAARRRLRRQCARISAAG
jgi:hypothetical protein